MTSHKPKIEADFSELQTSRLHPCLEAAIKFWEYHKNIIYCMSNDVFYKYEKGVFKKINTVEIIKLLTRTEDIDNSKQLSRNKKLEIVQNMKDELHYNMDSFNPDGIINFENCYLNLNKLEVIEHSPSIISTIQLPYKYDKDAECNLWKKVLIDIFEGDQEKIETLQEFAGYCLVKDTKYEKALFLLGDGSNGKSTVLEGLRYMLGQDNVSSLSLRLVSDPAFVGTLMNKYANIVSEIPKNVSDYEDDFKTIVSGEPVTVNTKYEQTYHARPFCKLIFAANRMPRIGDTSQAVYRRLLVIRFDKEFKEIDQDKELKFKLKNESSGMFNWAVEGLKRLQDRGYFLVSTKMAKHIREIAENNNIIMQFFNEMIEIVPNNEEEYLTKAEVFSKYQKFCDENDSKARFNKWNFSDEFWKLIKSYSRMDAKKNILIGHERKSVRIWPCLRWQNHFEEQKQEVKWDE